MYIICSIKITKGIKSGKHRNTEQGQQIENSWKYDRYYSALNVNGINTPIKKWIVTMDHKTIPNYALPSRNLL